MAKGPCPIDWKWFANLSTLDKVISQKFSLLSGPVVKHGELPCFGSKCFSASTFFFPLKVLKAQVQTNILSENGHFLKGHNLRSEKKVLLKMSGYDPDKQEPSSFYDFLRFITFFKIELNKFQTEIQITCIIQCVTFYDSGPPSFGPDDFLQK